jgi:hypothetical protein
VFSDDLVIYSKTWYEHLKHVDEILTIMEEQSIFSKEENSEFGLKEILYLGHVIGVEGLKVHEDKIHPILYWPTPISLTYLVGFFEICSYYRHLVKGFSQLVAPLIDLTKKGEF